MLYRREPEAISKVREFAFISALAAFGLLITIGTIWAGWEIGGSLPEGSRAWGLRSFIPTPLRKSGPCCVPPPRPGFAPLFGPTTSSSVPYRHCPCRSARRWRNPQPTYQISVPH